MFNYAVQNFNFLATIRINKKRNNKKYNLGKSFTKPMYIMYTRINKKLLKLIKKIFVNIQ